MANKRCTVLVLVLVFVLFVFMISYKSLEEIKLYRPPKVGNVDVSALETRITELQKENSELQRKRTQLWDSYDLPTKMELLHENPVYSDFKVAEKKNVTLLLIVSSAPVRSDRREAIRNTWWTQCLPTEEVVPECVFMTDHVEDANNTAALHANVKREAATHGDIRYQNLEGGVEFGRRMLYHMVWAMTRYNFDYFLRLDDDYYICLERLLLELPVPMERYFHWGWTHCHLPIVRPEESSLMLSRDVIETFLAQPSYEMRCHPWADQMIGVWMNDLGLDNLWRHDHRLLHQDGPHRDANTVKNACESYIGIHSAYPSRMLTYWNNSRPFNPELVTGNIRNTKKCELSNKFDYSYFNGSIWYYKPERCVTKPRWNTKKQQNGESKIYAGRGG